MKVAFFFFLFYSSKCKSTSHALTFTKIFRFFTRLWRIFPDRWYFIIWKAGIANAVRLDLIYILRGSRNGKNFWNRIEEFSNLTSVHTKLASLIKRKIKDLNILWVGIKAQIPDVKKKKK